MKCDVQIITKDQCSSKVIFCKGKFGADSARRRRDDIFVTNGRLAAEIEPRDGNEEGEGRCENGELEIGNGVGGAGRQRLGGCCENESGEQLNGKNRKMHGFGSGNDRCEMKIMKTWKKNKFDSGKMCD